MVGLEIAHFPPELLFLKGGTLLKLTEDGQDMLDGKEGLPRAKAMEILVKYGDALGAERFVNTNNNVHSLC